ncbi:MAG: hypothetical protein GF334_05810 [Candidatus Altiarchaeales archaeon]|nr:hypothetical protein [Candidatus Altiarchaeales archaeon]
MCVDLKLGDLPLWLGFSLGLASIFYWRMKKTDSPVDFKKIELDEEKKEIELTVENKNEHPVYVKPAIRKITFTSPCEWRNQTNNMPFMAAQGASVIKGMDLLGEYAQPDVVPPKSRKQFTYPVRQGFEFNSFDNIRVDAICGVNKKTLQGSATTTLQLRIKPKNLKPVVKIQGENGKTKNQKPTEKQGNHRKPQETYENPTDVREIWLPLQAPCEECHQVRWLNWVADDKQICDSCRAHLDYSTIKQPLIEEAEESDEDDVIEDFELEEMESVTLKPRHMDLLKLFDVEDKLTAKQAAYKLNRSRVSTSNDLRYLFRNNLLSRVKIGRSFHYFSLRDRDQIVLYEDEENLVEESQWT